MKYTYLIGRHAKDPRLLVDIKAFYGKKVSRKYLHSQEIEDHLNELISKKEDFSRHQLIHNSANDAALCLFDMTMQQRDCKDLGKGKGAFAILELNDEMTHIHSVIIGDIPEMLKNPPGSPLDNIEKTVLDPPIEIIEIGSNHSNFRSFKR